MRIYNGKLSSRGRVDFGLGLAVGLGFFKETQGWVAEVETSTNALDQAHNDRLALRKPQVKARMRVQYASYQMIQTIRVFGRMVEVADGGHRGPLHAAMFPDGVSPVARPTGMRQIEPAGDLIGRLDHCNLDGAEALREEWKPKLQQPYDLLCKAGKEYQDVTADYVEAFRKELGLRASHRVLMKKVAGALRMTFPEDKAKQDLVFPQFLVAKPGKASDAENEEDVEPDPEEPEQEEAEAVKRKGKTG